jgi:hypothetical protein
MKRDGTTFVLDDGTVLAGSDVASLEAALEAVTAAQERLERLALRIERLRAVAAFLTDEQAQNEERKQAGRQMAARRAAERRGDRSWWVLQ